MRRVLSVQKQIFLKNKVHNSFITPIIQHKELYIRNRLLGFFLLKKLSN